MTRLMTVMLVIGALVALPACKPLAPTASTAGSNSRTSPSTSVSGETTPSATASTSADVSTTSPAASASSGSKPVADTSDALHSPKVGTPERKAILNALRVPVERKLKQPVVFQVSNIAVKSGWAFVESRPLQPDGSGIDYSKTPYAQAVKDGMFGDGVDALLRRNGGSWTVVTYDIGATDVEWLTWPQDYGAPTAIFPNL